MSEGMLTLDQLKAEVEGGHHRYGGRGAWSTCRAASSASASTPNIFVDGGYEETHGCNYLLGVDIEMEPVPGYKATSWEKGYGDFVLKPDLATLRRTPWLPGTALVLCDVLDHHTHEDVPHSPARHPEEAAEAPRGDEDEGLHGLRARVLPVRRFL